MKQYCRYCNNLVTGNGIYCTLKNKELSESFCKGTNNCKDFEFNELDAFGENEKPYTPRPVPEEDDEPLEGQIDMFGRM